MEVTRYVLGFAFNMDCSDVLLIEKARPAWQAGKLNGIGGHIEGIETPYEAMAREMREETGLSSQPLRWSHFCTMQGSDFEVHCFHTQFPEEYLRGYKQATDEKVCIASTRVVQFTGVPVLPNLKWLVPMAREHALNGGAILEIKYP